MKTKVPSQLNPHSVIRPDSWGHLMEMAPRLKYKILGA